MDLDKIYHQDCLEGMQRIPDHSIDIVIANERIKEAQANAGHI